MTLLPELAEALTRSPQRGAVMAKSVAARRAGLLACMVVLACAALARAQTAQNRQLAPRDESTADGPAPVTLDLGNGSALVIDPNRPDRPPQLTPGAPATDLRAGDSPANWRDTPQEAIVVPNRPLRFESTRTDPLNPAELLLGVAAPNRADTQAGGNYVSPVRMSRTLRTTLLASGLAITFVILAAASRMKSRR
jgi:hypothetical protein